MRILSLLLAVVMQAAAAQTPEPPPPTVVISAARPDYRAAYAATEARIRKRLAQQPRMLQFVRDVCMYDQFDSNLDVRIRCGRAHIEGKDKALQQALDTFDEKHYAAALGLFRSAYEKLGNQDAALMLAKMHIDGLGTPKDAAQGVKWLKEVADGKFDPWRDVPRFNPNDPQAKNARIESALMLAGLYASGDGVEKDEAQARHWTAQAQLFGYVPPPAPPPPAPAATEVARTDVAAPQPRLAEALAVDAPPAALESAPDAPASPVPGVGPAAAPMAPVAPASSHPVQADTGAFTVVRVTGLRAIPWKSYRAMRAAVAAYEQYKFLAPDTAFRFAVMPPPGTKLPPDFKLRVRTEDGKEIPITLVNGELFQLPELPDPKVEADLVSNFKGGPLRIGLLVHTASVPPEKERLGDVRLRNEIILAIAEVDHPSDDPRCMRGRRNAIECPRPRLAVWYRPRAATSAGWIVDGGRKEPLETNDNPAYPAYKMPVRAGHLSNDAIIEFAYRKPLGPVILSEVAIYDAAD